jgi:hypothetical protein
MEHVFLLFVFLNKQLVSSDLYFRDLRECVWYAQTLHKQGSKITSYCLPKYIDTSKVRVY